MCRFAERALSVHGSCWLRECVFIIMKDETSDGRCEVHVLCNNFNKSKQILLSTQNPKTLFTSSFARSSQHLLCAMHGTERNMISRIHVCTTRRSNRKYTWKEIMTLQGAATAADLIFSLKIIFYHFISSSSLVIVEYVFRLRRRRRRIRNPIFFFFFSLSVRWLPPFPPGCVALPFVVVHLTLLSCSPELIFSPHFFVFFMKQHRCWSAVCSFRSVHEV